jgi:hypothetical protein
MRPVLTNLFPEKSTEEIDGILEEMRSQPQLLGAPFSDLSQITGGIIAGFHSFLPRLLAFAQEHIRAFASSET